MGAARDDQPSCEVSLAAWLAENNIVNALIQFIWARHRRFFSRPVFRGNRQSTTALFSSLQQPLQSCLPFLPATCHHGHLVQYSSCIRLDNLRKSDILAVLGAFLISLFEFFLQCKYSGLSTSRLQPRQQGRHGIEEMQFDRFTLLRRIVAKHG